MAKNKFPVYGKIILGRKDFQSLLVYLHNISLTTVCIQKEKGILKWYWGYLIFYSTAQKS